MNYNPPEENDEYGEAYDLGFAAGRDGFSAELNPYPDTECKFYWARGWNDSRE